MQKTSEVQEKLYIVTSNNSVNMVTLTNCLQALHVRLSLD